MNQQKPWLARFSWDFVVAQNAVLRISDSRSSMDDEVACLKRGRKKFTEQRIVFQQEERASSQHVSVSENQGEERMLFLVNSRCG